MSVLIKGMVMPDSCYDCPVECEGDMCEITKYRCSWDVRPPHCPLVHVPEHGRLIDADAYRAEMKQRQDACAEWRVNAIADGDSETYHRADGALSVFCEAKLTLDKMPTIIPAEEGET